MKKEGKGRAAELMHLTVRILTLPPIVIGVTLAMLYARSAERGAQHGAGLRSLVSGAAAFAQRVRPRHLNQIDCSL